MSEHNGRGIWHSVQVVPNGANANQPPRRNYLEMARLRQGLSQRCVAKRMGITVAEVRAQECAAHDLRLSELYRWQAALEVPLNELLSEPEDTLAPEVLDRARMLRAMKTARAVLTKARSAEQKRLAQNLVDQLTDVMPELKAVPAWPSVGQRRTSEELGRLVENPIPETWIHEAG